MPIQETEKSFNHKEIEKKIQDFWKKNNIYDEVNLLRGDGPKYSFFLWFSYPIIFFFYNILLSDNLAISNKILSSTCIFSFSEIFFKLSYISFSVILENWNFYI